MDIVRWAPTAKNSQLVKWIVVDGRKKMRELAELMVGHMKTSDKFQRQVEAWNNGKDVLLRGAPALAIAYTDAEYAWGEVDCVIAMQTLDLCATAMRFGTCWAGYFISIAQNAPEIKKWLGLQSNDKLWAALMFGYPGLEAYHRVPYRKEIDLRWIQ